MSVKFVAVTNASGTLISQQRYLPLCPEGVFGGERTNLGSISQTDYGYTGQRDLDPGMGGLMDYKARFYSPYLNHFIQPDSIVPNPSNPQAWNRFGYVHNNPINFNDPNGHARCNADGYCGKIKSLDAELWSDYKVKLRGDWKPKEKIEALLGVIAVGEKFGQILNMSGSQAFTSVFDNLEFSKSGTGGICQGGRTTVTCGGSAAITARFLIHELGHTFDHTTGYSGRFGIMEASVYSGSSWVTGINSKGIWERGLAGYPNTSGDYGVPDLYHGPGNWSDWNQNQLASGEYTGTAYNEEWADMFLNWVEGTFVGSAGSARDRYMTNYVSSLYNIGY